MTSPPSALSSSWETVVEWDGTGRNPTLLFKGDGYDVRIYDSSRVRLVLEALSVAGLSATPNLAPVESSGPETSLERPQGSRARGPGRSRGIESKIPQPPKKGGRTTKLTVDQIGWIQEQHAQGRSAAEIADVLKVHVSSVYRYSTPTKASATPRSPARGRLGADTPHGKVVSRAKEDPDRSGPVAEEPSLPLPPSKAKPGPDGVYVISETPLSNAQAGRARRALEEFTVSAGLKGPASSLPFILNDPDNGRGCRIMRLDRVRDAVATGAIAAVSRAVGAV